MSAEAKTKKRVLKSPKGYYTKKQVAEILGISTRTLDRRVPEMFDEMQTILFLGKRIFEQKVVDNLVGNYIKENA